MKQSIISVRSLRQRRFLLLLPLLVLPFIALLFWALGGGGTNTSMAAMQSGFNIELPGAQLKDGKENKLSLYRQADKDSLQLREQIENDPYFAQLSGDSLSGSPGTTAALAPGELAVSERMEQLNAQLSQSSSQPGMYPAASAGYDPGMKTDLDRMDAMMQAIGGQGQDDPEMTQLNGMLDKILDIQHPGRAREKLREQSVKQKKQVFAVAAEKQDQTVQLLAGPPGRRQGKGSSAKQITSFYEWSEQSQENQQATPSVAAVVQETRTVTAGATIKLRLLDDVFIRGELVPRGQFIYGSCSISEDRLLVSVPSIRYRNTIYPVSLSGFDMDGIAGIYIPGAIGRDVAKGTAEDAIQGIDIYADNTLTSQAASVGVQAAKGLFSKKARQVKVTVKAGYRLLLKDTNAND